MCIRLDTIPACDGWTDRQICHNNIMLCSLHAYVCWCTINMLQPELRNQCLRIWRVKMQCNAYSIGLSHYTSCWIVFGQARATVMRATRKGVSPTTNYVTVEKSRQCRTSSTLVHWPNLTAVYCTYMKQMSCRRLADNIHVWLLAHDNNYTSRA